MEAYQELVKEIETCQLCPLAQTRNRAVAGAGNMGARLMLIGEGPGAEEDKNGVPFVGAAGRLLSDMLDAVDIKRDSVYITNIVKCRPPGNRNPKDEEAAACMPYLYRQIALVDPQVILLLGAVALNFFLDKDMRITKVRGNWYQWEGRWVMPTFHPAYLLRNGTQKPSSFEDMVALRVKLKELEG
ncbi:uracil-DNA glycosylase [Eubacteriales bacterium OttesenSCG-928-M02]|nr:uracil-DNA glycosylase [Eubacteriales bacterium OttesenSCG-928-M02]